MKRVGKYAPDFKGIEILPIPELVTEVEPKILFYIIKDLRTKRLAKIRKDTFEELLKSAGIPCRYFCRQSFPTWDVLLPSEELAMKLAGSNVTTKHFQLQPEYKHIRWFKVTVCCVPMQLNGDILAAYMSAYCSVEMSAVHSANRMVHGDFLLDICLNRESFQAIPHILTYKDQQMMVVVVDKRPLCWSYKQLGHLSKAYPQKTTNKINNNSNPEKKHLPNYQSCSGTWESHKLEDGWTQVTRKGKKTLTTEPAVGSNSKINSSINTETNWTSKTGTTSITTSITCQKIKKKDQKEKYRRTDWGDGDLHKSKEVERQWGNQSQKTLYTTRHPHRNSCHHQRPHNSSP